MVTQILAGCCLTALGFNTLDWQINTFMWAPPWTGPWRMTTTLSVDPWIAYFYFGILPLAIGVFNLGWALCYVLHKVAEVWVAEKTVLEWIREKMEGGEKEK